MESNQTPDPNIQEMQQTAKTIEKLVGNKSAFSDAYAAFVAEDAAKFESALAKVGIAERCHIVCRFFCKKHCVRLYRKFCPQPQQGEVDEKEILAFSRAIAPLFVNEAIVARFLAITESEDIEAWNELIKKYKLEAFCLQLCVLLCSLTCKKRCHKVCPPKPLITRVGSIPVDQITSLGFGNGPGVPPYQVGAPDFVTTGNHPFGASVWLMGVFNYPAATQYMVEIADDPTGPYAAIDGVPVPGYNPNPSPPPPNIDIPAPGRLPVPASGGWYNISEIPSSDGGPVGNNEKTLMYWPSASVADGVHYLRLQVRDGVGTTRVSSPQTVVIDNSGPFPLPRPTIKLELQKADGTIKPLKCGKVHKGDGFILVTIHAFDPNLSGVSVTARGNSGLEVPVEGIPLPLFPGGSVVPLSKFYNGSLTEKGYTVPTSFVWDPFSDPRYVPCCYLVYVEVNDRTILNNSYSGGHYNSGWEAIEIGL